MTYQEFKQNLIHTISDSLGANFEVSLQDITKNNNTHLDALVILSNQSNISPTIYLNYYYKQYVAGKSFTAICKEILISYQKNTPQKKIDVSFFTDFEKVKEHLIFKLVNYEQNKELLSKVPHVQYLDLAILFYYLLKTADDSYGTILIYHQHLSFWNLSQEALFHLALHNTKQLLPSQLQNMAEVLSHLFHKENPDLLDEKLHPIPMYILSNTSKLNGSACILYENLLSDISNQLQSDFYILPSSVHEVLLIPVEYVDSAQQLTSMVKEVNATQLSKDEILSDHVYYYSRLTGEITM